MGRTMLLVTGLLAVTLVSAGCDSDSLLGTDDVAATLDRIDDRGEAGSGSSSSHHERTGDDDRHGSDQGEAGDDRSGSGHDDEGGDDRSGPGNGGDDEGDVVASSLLRLRCELRTGERSRVSVDGNDLRPLNELFSARIRSGTNTASAAAARAIGDEVEFDFDSDRTDIAAGATMIPRNFIQVLPGKDVTAEILNQSGLVVATAAADCDVR